MQISSGDLAAQLARSYCDGHVERLVLQPDLAACGTDARNRLVVSLPPLLRAQFLPYSVVIDTPWILGSLIGLLPELGSTTEFAYDDAIQSLVFVVENQRPIACPVWPMSEKEMAEEEAWLDAVLSSYDYSRAVSLNRDATDIMETVGLRFRGQMLRLQVDSMGAFLVPSDGSARFPVPMSTEEELTAEVWTDVLIRALDHLYGSPRLVPNGVDGSICLTDDSALYVLS